ncbi:MAG: hypothetical protein JWN15_1500, partial [Firmicutes bacterium]|nr:hypothetical protein [Bacillota bacterium]
DFRFGGHLEVGSGVFQYIFLTPKSRPYRGSHKENPCRSVKSVESVIKIEKLPPILPHLLEHRRRLRAVRGNRVINAFSQLPHPTTLNLLV